MKKKVSSGSHSRKHLHSASGVNDLDRMIFEVSARLGSLCEVHPAKDDPGVCQRPECPAPRVHLYLVEEREAADAFMVECSGGHLTTVFVNDEDHNALATWSTEEEFHIAECPACFDRHEQAYKPQRDAGAAMAIQNQEEEERRRGGR
jgi:hypothetical protein